MEYLVHLGIFFLIYSILAMSLNLVVGYTGILSLAHAAFYGIGAYATAITLTEYQMPFLFSIVIGMFLAGVAGCFVGAVLGNKLDGDYFALGSLGFTAIVYSFFLNLDELTRGPLGIPGIERPSFGSFVLSENWHFLLLTLFFVGLVYLLCRWITHSPFGRVLKAIREDEKAIQVFGYDTRVYKVIIVTVSAILASVAGSLFASYISFIDPSAFTIHESIFILAIIILGGLANIHGSLLGALFLVLLPEALRFVGFPSDIAAQMRQFAYGALLVVLMMYRPQGLRGEYKL